MADKDRTARERMVYSAAQLVRTRGMAATGVRDVVAAAEAPRGSFQHYFPGGKDQLVGEALQWSARFAADSVRGYVTGTRRPSPEGLFEHMASQWRQEFDRRGYARGCPLMATAAEVLGADSALIVKVQAAAEEWSGAVETELVAMAVSPARARRLATLMISALEGAIMLTRLRQDTTPLTAVVRELRPVLAAAPRQRR